MTLELHSTAELRTERAEIANQRADGNKNVSAAVSCVPTRPTSPRVQAKPARRWTTLQAPFTMSCYCINELPYSGTAYLASSPSILLPALYFARGIRRVAALCRTLLNLHPM